MRIDGIKMQKQIDCNDIMTFPMWQRVPDRVSQYGCLLTAKLNCRNLYFHDTFLSLNELNQNMIEKRGYYYLYYLYKYCDVDKAKKECFQRESYAIKKILNDILNIKKEKEIKAKDVDLKSSNDFFIVRTEYGDTGHYSMVVRSDLSYLDSYDGKIKKPEEILNIYKITF